MAWPQNPRPAKALLVLRNQIDALAPDRSRTAEGGKGGGMLGDSSHQGRTSDHNPDASGVVTALDITHDPSHGIDTHKMSEQLFGDERVKYIISNRRIASGTDQGHPAWVWRTYEGTNPHDLHFHVSVKDEPRFYDNEAAWVFHTDAPQTATPPTTRGTVKRGDSGEDVKAVQRLIMVDGDFGALTEIAVMQFQGKHGLYPDGIVGPYTWRELEKLKTPAPGEPAPPSEGEWQTRIVATVFGGSEDPNNSAYDNHFISDTELGVSLPYRFRGARPRVQVKGPSGTAIANIVDVGPWNISDPYWENNRRPQAETGRDLSGRKTNDAGIDLTPAMAKAVGIDGLGTVDWRFV